MEALATLDEALALWHGRAVAEFADLDFARGAAVRLDERRATAEAARLEALLRLGRADEVVAESLRLCSSDPYREVNWERRMQALHATGRTSDAVRAFHDYRVFLANETGLAPSADLAALERALVASPPVREPVAVEPLDGVLPEPATSFLGRDAAIDELIELLTSNRIVTLVGPGGVGKTRLAIEVARAARIRAPTTAWFVELVAPPCRGGRARRGPNTGHW